MIVVSDTSPLNYLVLTHLEHLLPAVFGRVIVPPTVIAELRREKTPTMVRAWANAPPMWLEVQAPQAVAIEGRLGPGETEAIALAQELHADALLLDERDGVAVARRLGLFVIGTLGALVLASERGIVSLQDSIAALRQTTFRGPAELIEELLRHDAERRREHGM